MINVKIFNYSKYLQLVTAFYILGFDGGSPLTVVVCRIIALCWDEIGFVLNDLNRFRQDVSRGLTGLWLVAIVDLGRRLLGQVIGAVAVIVGGIRHRGLQISIRVRVVRVVDELLGRQTVHGTHLSQWNVLVEFKRVLSRRLSLWRVWDHGLWAHGLPGQDQVWRAFRGENGGRGGLVLFLGEVQRLDKVRCGAHSIVHFGSKIICKEMGCALISRVRGSLM